MRNKYLAKVLVANKFITEDDVKSFWPQVNSETDFGQVLLKAHKIDEKTYKRVLAYVIQLESKHSNQELQSIKQNNASVKQDTFGARQVPKEELHSVQKNESTLESYQILKIEGNNSLYGSSSASSGVQVEQVAGLESTKMAGGFGVSTSKTAADDFSTTKKLPDRFILSTGSGEGTIPESISPKNSIVDLIHYARAFQVTDIYLFENKPVALRRFGTLYPATESTVSADRLNEWLLEMSKGFADYYAPCVGKNFQRTFALPTAGRARLTVTWSGVIPSISIRLIPNEIPALENLYLPDFVQDFVNIEHGLVLIAGPSSSGRSTTLSAFGNAIAASKCTLLETVEHPIENLLHNPNGALVQREIGLHTVSGIDGIKTAMSDGANVLLYDFISSVEELSALLSAANAGILVIATTGGNDAQSLFNRFLDTTPKENRVTLASSLADRLKGVIVQHLVPLSSGEGEVLSVEAFKVTSTISNLLRNGETSSIPSALPTMRSQAISLDDSLQALVDAGYINGLEAWKRALDTRRFAKFRPERS